MGFPKMTVKRFLRLFNLDVQRYSHRPEVTLLGMKKLRIRTIIDVGANVGQFAQMINRSFPQARIYSFEPLPDIFAELKKCRNTQMFPIQVALGDCNGEMEMHKHIDHTASSSFLHATAVTTKYYPATKRQSSTRVQIMTLDRAVEAFDICVLDDVLIKLDVQGFEDRVIRGGPETFAKASACIIEINLQNLYTGQARFSGLLSMLEQSGLRYGGNLEQVVAPDGSVIAIDATFFRKAC